MRFERIAAGALAAAGMIGSRPAWAQVSVHTIAVTGQTAPNGDTFDLLGGARVGGDGSVAFTSGATPSIWRWSDANGLQLIARPNMTAPGASGGKFFGSHEAVLDDQGRVAFWSQLDPSVDISQDRGIWVGTPGSLSLVAIEGAVAPGTGGVLFDSLNNYGVMMGGNGCIAYKALLRGVPASSAWGLWRYDAGVGSLVARGGNIAPGTGAPFSGFGAPFTNGAGDVVFAATGANNASEGVWRHNGVALSAVLARGPAPGFPSGTTFLGLYGADICINNYGQVAFTGSLSGAPDGALTAMYLASPGGVFDVVAVQRRQASGKPAGYMYNLIQPIAVGDLGALLFFCQILDDHGIPAGYSLYVADDTSTRPIHSTGESAGGGGPALTYDYFNYPPNASINASAQAVITLVDTHTQGAIIGYTPYSGVFPIAVPGTQLEIAPGVVRTVQSAYESRLNGYRLATFDLTDAGRTVFYAHFTDGSDAVCVADFLDFRSAARCAADFDANDFVNGDDFDFFIEAFYYGLTTADFDANGYTNGDDFDGFMLAFYYGC